MSRTVNGIITNAAVTTIEDVALIDVRGAEVLFVTFLVGGAALTAFTVQFRVSSGGGWITAASAAGNYTSPVAPVLAASGDLNIAAQGATVHYVKLDVRGVESVLLRASSATSATINGHYGTT